MSMPEKQGNAAFIRCPLCAQWFTVTAALIDMATIPLYCPSCTHRFCPENAAEIDRP